MTDSFYPVLDDNLFPLLLAESKSTCFLDLKNASNPKAEQTARKILIRSQNDMRKIKLGKTGPNYGRRGYGWRWPYNGPAQ